MLVKYCSYTCFTDQWFVKNAENDISESDALLTIQEKQIFYILGSNLFSLRVQHS